MNEDFDIANATPVRKLLEKPRSFTDQELDELRSLEAKRKAFNPLWPISHEAVQMHFLLAEAELANRKNAERAWIYPQMIRDWEANHVQNPQKYQVSIRPKPAAKLVIGLSAEGWPVVMASTELVTKEIPFQPIVEPPQKPLVVAMYEESNPHYPDEYPCKPEDTAPIGYQFKRDSDGVVFTRMRRATPFGVYNFYKIG